MGVVIWQLLSGQDTPYNEVEDNVNVMLGLHDGSLVRVCVGVSWGAYFGLMRLC